MGNGDKISSKKEKRKMMHSKEITAEEKNVGKKKKTKKPKQETNDDVVADVPKKVKTKSKNKEKNTNEDSAEDQLLISDITKVLGELFDEYKKETEAVRSENAKKDKKQKKEKSGENSDNKSNTHKVFNDDDFASSTSYSQEVEKMKKDKRCKSEREQSQSDIDTNYESSMPCSANGDCFEDVKKDKKSISSQKEISGKDHMDAHSVHGDEFHRKKKKRKRSKGHEHELETTVKSAANFTHINTGGGDNKKSKKHKSVEADYDVKDTSISCIESSGSGIEKKKSRKTKHSCEGESEVNQFYQDHPVTGVNCNFEKEKKKKKKSKVKSEMDDLVDSVGSNIDKDCGPNERERDNEKGKTKCERTEGENSENEMPMKKKRKDNGSVEGKKSKTKSQRTEDENENEIGLSAKKNRKDNESVESKKSKKKRKDNESIESKKSKKKSEITEDGNGGNKMSAKRKGKDNERVESKKNDNDSTKDDIEIGLPAKKKSKDCESVVKLPFQESCNSPVFDSEERQEKFKRLLGGKKSKGSSTCEAGMLITKETTTKNNDISVQSDNSLSALSTGQWSGMMFENADRQNKFIRLLGGAKPSAAKKNGLFSSVNTTPKKGLFGSLTSKMGANGPGNIGGGKAMDLHASGSLSENLENDYNRALSRRLGGMGTSGIGFVKDPAEGKKFHINTSAVKSTKFSDDDE